jgi:hypothetical protein
MCNFPQKEYVQVEYLSGGIYLRWNIKRWIIPREEYPIGGITLGRNKPQEEYPSVRVSHRTNIPQVDFPSEEEGISHRWNIPQEENTSGGISLKRKIRQYIHSV